MESPALRVIVGGREWTFDGSRPATVGRAEDADVRVDDPKVSRTHGEFRPEAGGWTYHHVGTSLGSFHNRGAVKQVVVGKAVTLHLGDAESGPELIATTATPPGRPAAATANAGPAAVYLPTTPTIRIGRASDNDVVVTDMQASNYHAELRLDGATREIVDLGSRNGTYVDGRRVRVRTRRRTLRHHHRLGHGSTSTATSSRRTTRAARSPSTPSTSPTSCPTAARS